MGADHADGLDTTTFGQLAAAQMGPDDGEIAEVHSIWIDAVNSGNLACLLSLMALSKRRSRQRP